jgi:formiminotetrahydrofolate cyclodeaminase
VDEDAAAYQKVGEAYKLPKDDPRRSQVIDAALVGAARTPLDGAKRAARVIALARELATIGNKNARSDAAVATQLAQAAVAGMVENVRINIASLSEPGLGRQIADDAEALARALSG